MKAVLSRFFEPLLRRFETGQAPANYKESHRKALLAMGILFLILACVSVVTAFYAGSAFGALIPALAFFCVGLVALVIGSLGSNAAVAKIWGTK
ncbi:hypothetical protein RS130_11760 [Paraglaciecola aquimarina]|uniref:Uncharacterized protein n=1 Tax=Paraglaciecola aquimarina TaxID=1235557 RepID=A0ABU3SWZ3_9ALTE|nr:hypothetical protein [Paraglaciecola aquimarina]MDU0354521.1 hypothetical protein [Paraglaciecola aquimarina]